LALLFDLGSLEALVLLVFVPAFVALTGLALIADAFCFLGNAFVCFLKLSCLISSFICQ
jgi:hypothetical protein